ncbi:MAG: hypothetical protein M5U28_32595 [Sandaracinaceae bacterium]|nr:hypothetical protein [Sandaracinaceae bacterium]
MLPLPKDELPEKIRRFADPAAPAAARAMAAKGLVPVKGEDLVSLLVQLAHDPEAEIASAATATLGGLPEGVLEAACRAALHAAILDGLAELVRDRQPLVEEICANRATSDETLARIARTADERTCERIAVDQQRLLAAPAIIEALYKNRNTRTSTVDRLVELAARNGVELTGVATFQAHVEAIQGELIIDEPTEEPLPDDVEFANALAVDDDGEPIDTDAVDGTEEVKDSHRPLMQKISGMTTPQKVRLCLIGNAAARAILVRDANKTVAMAAISSPGMSEAEAARIAVSKQIGEDILRYIGNRRDWLGNYEVKRNLVFNPKTPTGISLRFLSHLRFNDLRSLARSKNVPASLRTAATQRVSQKDKQK